MKTKISFLLLLAAVVLTGASCIQLGSSAQGVMGVFKSADKGETWSAAVAYPTVEGVKSLAGVKVYRFYTDPGDPQALYLASRGQGLFYTYDNGGSWQRADDFKNAFIYGMAIDPQNKCVLYVSDGAHIYKTVDCLRSFKLIYTEERPGERVQALGVDFGDSNVIYAAEYGGDLLISRDGGKSWQVSRRFGFQLGDLQADPLTPGRVFLASYRNGLIRSDDYGVSWSILNGGFRNFADSRTFYRLVLNTGERNVLFWISKYGILRSGDAGENWEALTLLTPPGSVNIFGFAVNPDNQKEMYYTGTILGDNNTHVRSTFYKTEDGGKNWVTKKMPASSIPTALIINPGNRNLLFMGFYNP